MRGNQLGPGNDSLHLLKELALAGFLAVQIKVQRGLFHAMYFIATGGFLQENLGGYAEFPLVKAGVTFAGSEYLLVVDRDPNIQALFLFFLAADGESQLVGASPVSTGRPGSFDHFEIPVGVVEHTTANPNAVQLGTQTRPS